MKANQWATKTKQAKHSTQPNALLNGAVGSQGARIMKPYVVNSKIPSSFSFPRYTVNVRRLFATEAFYNEGQGSVKWTAQV